MATETTVLLAPRRLSGNLVTPTFTIGADVLRLQVQANIADADKTAVGLTADVRLELQDAGGAFHMVLGFGWQSYGPAGFDGVDFFRNTVHNVDPWVSFVPQAGTYRVSADIPQPITVGASVTAVR